jgi:hypothetical protein
MKNIKVGSCSECPYLKYQHTEVIGKHVSVGSLYCDKYDEHESKKIKNDKIIQPWCPLTEDQTERFAYKLESELIDRYNACEDGFATPSSILLAVLNAVSEARGNI